MGTLVEPRKKVGGWLIALIIWLGLWVPQGVCDEVMDPDRFFKALSAQYGGRFELIHGGCTALLWFTAIAGA
jgi:hypothetical protein